MLERVERFIARINAGVAFACGYLVSALVVITVVDVLLRYAFSAGSVRVQELEWHLFAIVILLIPAWCFDQDGHVRVDLLHQRYSARTKALVGLAGDLFFLLPFTVLLVYTSVPFVESSWSILEGSPDPGGLPYRFIVKAAIPIGSFLLLCSAVASVIRHIRVLRAGEG